MSGTGRRRKPPTGEEGGEQQYQQPGYEPGYGQGQQQPGQGQPPQYQAPQYQTYAPEPEPQYDYDWRQQSAPTAPPPTAQQPAAQQQPAAPAGPVSPSPFDPFHGYPAAPAQPAAPAVPQQPQYGVRPDPYAQPQEPPRQSALPPQRPRPRPEPQPEFDFDFDLDDPEPGGPAASGAYTASSTAPASAVSSPATAGGGAAPSAGASSRPADKDGYRPDDFDFVEKADDPDVNGWLSFSESRADSRAERVRKLRVRLIAGGVVLVLAAAGFGVYTWLGGTVPGLAAPQPTKSMILFRLDDTQGDSVGDALMVTKRGGSTGGTTGGSGAIVVIPSEMQINDLGFGDQPFGGDMPAQPPAGAPEVADTLGVTPDGMWTMDETTFGIFVDDLGGVSLTTNTAVPPSTADPKGVPAGQTSLTGVQAVAYATYQAKGEPGNAQAARFGQVLSALMAKMPTAANAVTPYLNNLGLIPDPSLPLSKLSPILAALAAQQASGQMTLATLPLAADGSNSLNSAGAAQIVSKLLGGTVKAGAPAGQSARVLVQNGTGAGSAAGGKLMAAAQAKLVDDGYTYNAGDTVNTQAKTAVEVASSSSEGLAQQVATSLGLSGSAVQVVPGLSSVDDVTVVLGQDWTALSTQ